MSGPIPPARAREWLRGKLPHLSDLPLLGHVRRRFLASHQQQRYNRTLALATHGPVAGTPHQTLESLRSARRTLSSRPRVRAMGHRGWEQHGLWPSFARLADFDLLEVDHQDGSWSEALREQA